MPMQKLSAKPSLLRRFAEDDQGSMTIWGLFVFFICGILGALALDVTHLIAARTHLQVAADQAAHAAIYQRSLIDDDDGVVLADVNGVKTMAADLARATLPTGRYGIALEEADINFGTFNTGTQQFVVNETSPDAVRARAYFTTANENPAVSFLFRLIGRDTFDVSAESVYIAYGKACLNEGYVANDVVDIQSNNSFGENFCVHSNTHVSVNQNNTYGAGTIVSMPDIADLDIPGGIEVDADGNIIDGDFSKNENLDKALTPGYIDLRVLNRIENLVFRYENPTADKSLYPYPLVADDTGGWPEYIDTQVDAYVQPFIIQESTITTEEIMAAGAIPPTIQEVTLSDGTIVEEVVDPGTDGAGRVYLIDCAKGNGNNTNAGLTIDASTMPIKDMIIISPCEISFKQGSVVQNARIITTAESANAISATSGLQLGVNSDCFEGAQLISMGGISIPAKLQLSGSQMIAMGDINFAAGADGMKGASLIAGGRIDGTSNGAMEVCNTGMLNNVAIRYFRMAM